MDLGRLNELLNFTDSEGKVITLFDGKMTLSQAVVGVVAIVGVLLIMKMVKKAFKWALIVAVACVMLVHYNVASPQQLRDVAGQIAEKGVDTYRSFANASQNVKIQGGSVYLRLDDNNWVNVTDISSIIGGGEKDMTVVVGGQTYTISDDIAQDLLNSLK